MPRLAVIIGTTRPGRAGRAVGEWFADRAREHGGFEVDLLDLAEINLPLLDEPNHPRLQNYENQHTKDWSTHVDRADAVVFVTAEYNHSYPAAVKNALDYLHHEWRDKAVGFVSYGGVSGGTRAVAQLKPVVSALRMVPVVDAVNLPFFNQFLNDEGRLVPNDVSDAAADTMLDELARFDQVLQPLREATRMAA